MILAPPHNIRLVPPLDVTPPRSGPSLFACAVSPNSVGCAPDSDEFFFLEYAFNEANKTQTTYVSVAKRSHEDRILERHAHGETTVIPSLQKSTWVHERLLPPLPEYCNCATTQLVLNRSATMLAVLSPRHLVVHDVHYHGKVSGPRSSPRHITLVGRRPHRPLVSCSWHPTLDDVLVVMDDLTITLYYFWDAAIAAQLSPPSNNETSATESCTGEGHWFWRDELEFPKISARNELDPFSSFCFGDQETLDEHRSANDQDGGTRSVSWEPFTVYVLHQSGGIYAACPVAPRGLVLEDDTIEMFRTACGENGRHEWINRNWAKCLNDGEDEHEWKCLNFQVESAAWYEASDNNNVEHNRASTLSATSLVSVRGVENISNSNMQGYPILVRSWSNGEIDTMIVHDTVDGRPSSSGYAPYTIGVACLARKSVFLNVPSSKNPRVRLLLDEMDDHVMYVVGSHEICRLIFSPLDVFTHLEEHGAPPTRLWEPLIVYYEPPNQGITNGQENGVVGGS